MPSRDDTLPPRHWYLSLLRELTPSSSRKLKISGSLFYVAFLLSPFVRESHPCALPPSAYLYSTLWHSRPGASPRSTYFCRTRHSEPSGSKPLNLSRTRLYYKSTFDALSRTCTLIGHRRSLPFIRFPSNLCLSLLLELGLKSMTLWARLEPNFIPRAKRDSWVLLFDCLGSLPLRASVASLIEHTCSCLLKMYVPVLIPNN